MRGQGQTPDLWPLGSRVLSEQRTPRTLRWRTGYWPWKKRTSTGTSRSTICRSASASRMTPWKASRNDWLSSRASQVVLRMRKERPLPISAGPGERSARSAKSSTTFSEAVEEIGFRRVRKERRGHERHSGDSPARGRYRLIKGSPETRGFYEKVLTAIKKETSDGLTDLHVREILSELAGMYMVLSSRWGSSWRWERPPASEPGVIRRNRTPSTRREQSLLVGSLMRTRQRNMPWYKNFPAEPEVVAGEAAADSFSWAHFRLHLASAPRTR
jgi:hypothetical protein